MNLFRLVQREYAVFGREIRNAPAASKRTDQVHRCLQTAHVNLHPCDLCRQFGLLRDHHIQVISQTTDIQLHRQRLRSFGVRYGQSLLLQLGL